jgi:LmbE family N-acetylglucosaminyl deacetylase
MSKTVLVVAAHADDEALGCGGTVARHVAEGDTVHTVFFTDGVSARQGADDDDLARRMAATEQARQILGIASNTFLGLPDNQLDGRPLIEVIQLLEQVVQQINPQIIYTHHYGDLNVDHRIVHQAVMTACRPVPGCGVREIYAFEVLSSTEWNAPAVNSFTPQLYVDITQHLDKKILALDAYRIEMRDAPHSRSVQSVRALAVHRGCCVGVNAAEAFMAVRIIR